jgi:DNA-binding CsgD family transcriptional regulator
VGFVGREVELGRLEGALQAAGRGDPSVVLLGGEAGVGKTRLLEQFQVHARGQGALVLAGACLELGEEGLPFAAVAEALRSLRGAVGRMELRRLAGGDRAELARLIPGLHTGDEARHATAPGKLSSLSQLRLFEALLELLGGLAASRPVVFVLEDVHWADASTRDLLLFLAHNLREERLVLVASYRTDEMQRQHPLRLLLPRLLREDPVDHVDLVPLSREEVAALVEDLLGVPPGPELLGTLFERTGGNPFFIEQLVRSGAEVSALPELLRDVLLLAFDGLSDLTMRLLRVVSAAGGERVGHDLVARTAGIPDDDLDAAIREAVHAGVLIADLRSGSYGMRHALLAEAVLTTLLPGEAGRLHTRLAQAIEQDPRLAVHSATAELAYHLHLAGDQPRSMVASLDAAREAERTLGIDEARSHVERALALWDQVADAQQRAGLEHRELLEWAAWLSYLTGRSRRAIALQRAALDELPEEADPHRSAPMHESLGTYLWDVGDGAGAVRARAEAVRLLAPEPPSPQLASALASYSHILVLTHRDEESTEPGKQALDLARRSGDREVEAAVLGTLGTSRLARGDDGGLGLLHRSRTLAEELGDELQISRSYHNEASALFYVGRYDQAITVASAGLERVRGNVASSSFVPGLTASLARPALHRGRWELAAQVLRTAPRVAGNSFAAMNQLYLAYLAACRGELDRAWMALAEARRLGVQADDTAPDRVLMIQLAVALLGGDDAKVAAALDALPPIDERIEQSARMAEDAVELRALVLRALAEQARTGPPDRERADAVLAQCHEIARRVPVTLPPLKGWLMLAEAEHARLSAAPDAAEYWSAATAHCDQLGLAYQGAWTRLRHAETLLGGGSRRKARQRLHEAAERADELGAFPLRNELSALARRASIDLGHGRARLPAEPFGLTPRESEVLELVAAGRTNPEIAERLFISPKTASVHVSNILRKLEVSNRGEAAALAHRTRRDAVAAARLRTEGPDA